jgi:alginate O-acetyltransferase complex protein AlgI
VGAVFFRAADIATAWRLLVAMGGSGHAPIAEAITLQHDWWAIGQGWISEAFIRTWIGSTWSATGTTLTLLALAIALLVPDTMEITGYREADAQSNWRRSVSPLAWRPSLVTICIVFLLFSEVYFRLGQVSEFLYYQF